MELEQKKIAKVRINILSKLLKAKHTLPGRFEEMCEEFGIEKLDDLYDCEFEEAEDFIRKIH